MVEGALEQGRGVGTGTAGGGQLLQGAVKAARSKHLTLGTGGPPVEGLA